MEKDLRTFICSECGSLEASLHTMVSPIPDADDAWSDILQTMTCAGCGFDIPAHLAERWDGITIEQAQQEWRKIYKPTASREDDE